MLVDLHVYIIPKKIWKNRQNLAENEVIKQAVSAGFVHVPESLTIHELRQYIINICGEEENFPKEFNYLRSVGRCLTKVKTHQEKELKVKNYRPPMVCILLHILIISRNFIHFNLCSLKALKGTVFAPEIYILGKHDDDDEEYKKDDLVRESTMSASIMSSPNWIKPMDEPSLLHPLFNHNHIQQISSVTPTLSNKRHSIRSNESNIQNSAKLREEQERLYLLQKELARKRHELEDQHKKEKAAIKIQTAFRNYRHRHHIKQQQQQEADAIEYERSQKERRKLTYRKYNDNNKTYDVTKSSNRLETLKAKRIVIENNRVLIVNRLRELLNEITVRRREETDLRRQKYFIEKNQITTWNKKDGITSKNPVNLQIKFEQTVHRLNDATKV
ncbi:unnamed protein product [Rotaria sp. Silwood1]|nr:unnamed protein product [Rotaria sp. Silwood1]CAF4820253.1 unnamed protein product [Rotaria sp. Silwood1]